MAPLTLSRLRWAGLGAWLLVGVPILAGGHRDPLSTWLAWLAAFAAFGLAYLPAVRLAGLGRNGAPLRLLLAVQLAALLAMVLLLCDGFEGMLLVLLALQIAFVAEPQVGLPWIALQSLLLAAAIAWHWSLGPALSLTPPYLGFQLLTYFTLRSLRAESEARLRLASAHGELRAMQSLLADGARAGERLRIARELHDALGHHLVLLGLHLEAAAQASASAPDEGGRSEVLAARSLARLLLTELGEVVAAQRQGAPFDLGAALGELVAEVPRPAIHLELAGDLRLEEAGLAQELLRCAQELVTNAVKHSGAGNLWLRLAREEGALRLTARDDGNGGREAGRTREALGYGAPGRDGAGSTGEAGAGAAEGHGLRGLSERCAAFGGSLEVERGREGFRVEIRAPLGEGA